MIPHPRPHGAQLETGRPPRPTRDELRIKPGETWRMHEIYPETGQYIEDVPVTIEYLAHDTIMLQADGYKIFMRRIKK